jgi:rsbT co-antagonist protein RsbR
MIGTNQPTETSIKISTTLGQEKNNLIQTIMTEFLHSAKAGSYGYKQKEQDIEKLEIHVNVLLDIITLGIVEASGNDTSLISWSQEKGQSDAESGISVTDVIEAIPYIRSELLTFIDKIGIDNQLNLEEVLSMKNSINQSLDLTILETVKAFNLYKEELLKKAHERIAALSVPIIPITEKLAILPLTGTLDYFALEAIKDQVPTKVCNQNIDCLIIDCSGLEKTNRDIIQAIFEIKKVLTLIGTETILTGINPSSAQSAITLGLDFSSVKTYLNSKQVLKAKLPFYLE